ncbi:hypothetical protein NA78x_001747 [Anatilimnocola sp. NA78]|uniref:hypothetical protein n=1 Tax=Anatilimnocola sp. NA78 TaxID=3415683 RepID=UPI003CE4B361
MALNFADQQLVRVSLISRCTAAVTKYARYIMGEAGNVANHANRLAWARNAMAAPQIWGERMSHVVVDQPDFISGGSSITDETLGGAIENAINAHHITPAA